MVDGLHAIIEKCKMLESIEVDLFGSVSGDTENSHSATNSIDKFNLSNSVKRYNIKKFIVRIASRSNIGDEFFQYVMHKFPNLNNFVLDYYNDHEYAITTISSAVAIQFVRAMTTIPMHRLLNIRLKTDQVGYVLDNYWNCLPSTRRENLQRNVRIAYDGFQQESDTYVVVSIDTHSNHPRSFTIKYYNSPTIQYLVMYIMEALEICDRHILDLDIDIKRNRTSNNNSAITPPSRDYNFDTLLLFCPNLRKLVISHCMMIYLKEEDSSVISRNSAVLGNLIIRDYMRIGIPSTTLIKALIFGKVGPFL